MQLRLQLSELAGCRLDECIISFAQITKFFHGFDYFARPARIEFKKRTV